VGGGVVAFGCNQHGKLGLGPARRAALACPPTLVPGTRD
jgi:hypothetical protein